MKKEVLIMLCVLGHAIVCYAANPLPGSDSQQRDLANNIINEQEQVVMNSDTGLGWAVKTQATVYVKEFRLDLSMVEKTLPPPQGTFGKIRWT